MHYIVGLGNPGKKYARTRHNMGWFVLDALRADLKVAESTLKKSIEARTTTGFVGTEEVVLAYPETFMNDSGRTVRALVPKHEYAKLIVVYDEINIPIGSFKLSVGNSAGGHNGVASIITALGTKDFIRVRVGIGQIGPETGRVVRPRGIDLSDFVLGTLSPADETALDTVMPKILEAIKAIVNTGVMKAMNQYNK